MTTTVSTNGLSAISLSTAATQVSGFFGNQNGAIDTSASAKFSVLLNAAYAVGCTQAEAIAAAQTYGINSSDILLMIQN